MGHPADVIGKVGASRGKQATALMGENALLSCAAEGPVLGVPLSDVVLAGDSGHLLGLVGWRGIAVRRRRADPQHRLLLED